LIAGSSLHSHLDVESVAVDFEASVVAMAESLDEGVVRV
jgi:hypothetical protein